MSKDSDNLAAFPFVGTYVAHPGMTLRDWFASQALVGLLGGRAPSGGVTPPVVAEEAYLIADAMLEQRKE